MNIQKINHPGITLQKYMNKVQEVQQLEGLGPVDNRPSTDGTCDTKGVVNIVSQCYLPSSIGLRFTEF